MTPIDFHQGRELLGRPILRLRKSDAIAPAALAFLLLALNALVRATSPIGNLASLEASHLVSFGSHYAPRTLDGEAWRLFVSLAIESNWQSVIVNTLSLSALGSLIVSRFGELRLFLTLLASGVAASVSSSVWDPQSVSTGVSTALFGLSFFTLTPFAFKKPQGRDWDLVVVSGVVLLAIASLALTSPWGTPFGYCVSAVTGMICRWVLVELHESRKLASTRTALRILTATRMISLTGAICLGYMLIPSGFDELAFVDSLRGVRRQVAKILKTIDEDYRSGRAREVEFSHRLELEVIKPLASALEELDDIIARDGKILWLTQEHSRLKLYKVSLELVREVTFAQETLRVAHDHLHMSSAEASLKLDAFWKSDRTRLLSSIENLKPMIATFTPEADLALNPDILRNHVERDLDRLTNAAIDLELLQTELWLSKLRKSIVSTQSIPSQNRRPASSTEILENTDKHIERLKQVERTLTAPDQRIYDLLNHLQEIRTAVDTKAETLPIDDPQLRPTGVSSDAHPDP